MQPHPVSHLHRRARLQRVGRAARVPRARDEGARGAAGRARGVRLRRRRQQRRFVRAARGLRRERCARSRRSALAQLRPADRDHRGPRPRERRLRGRDRRRSPRSARSDRAHGREMARRLRRRLRRAQQTPRRGRAEAAQRLRVLPAARSHHRHPHPARRRRFPPAEPPRAERAESLAREGSLRARARELDRVPAGGRRLRARAPRRRRDEVPGSEDARIRARWHRVVLDRTAQARDLARLRDLAARVRPPRVGFRAARTGRSGRGFGDGAGGAALPRRRAADLSRASWASTSGCCSTRSRRGRSTSSRKSSGAPRRTSRFGSRSRRSRRD